MNDLQILLISAGVILIVIVLAYNGWQEWRARRKMQQSVADDRHDVLMQQDSVVRREPTINQNSAKRPESEDNAEIDVLCEAVIDINLINPVKGEKIIQALAGLKQACSKPVRVFVNSLEGTHKTQINPDDEYVLIQLAVLLANRNGPLTEIDWSHLWSFAQNIADRLEGSIEAPEQSDVVKRAQQLDALCASMDAQVGLIIQLDSAMGAKEIGSIAARIGFVNNGGKWMLLADNDMPRFTLLIDQQADQQDAIHRVDLLLDVPNSMPDNQAFSGMVGVGRELANYLNAHLLDDQGRTFQDSSAAAIDKQLNDLYDKLDNAGFVAGTARAARVFA